MLLMAISDAVDQRNNGRFIYDFKLFAFTLDFRSHTRSQIAKFNINTPIVMNIAIEILFGGINMISVIIPAILITRLIDTQ